MGCVSSKLLKKNLKNELLFGSGDVPNHVVSLTSSTYGALKLDQNQTQIQKQKQKQAQFVVSSSSCAALQSNSKVVEEDESLQKKKKEEEENGGCCSKVGSKRLQLQEELEVINTWELMEGLEEEVPIKLSSSVRAERSPFKRLVVDHMSSPKEGRNLIGKENRGGVDSNSNAKKQQQCYSTPRSGAFKAWKFTSNSTNKLRKAASVESPRRSNSGVSSNRRRSLGPLFDPELIDSLERELSLEKEQIKEMVAVKEVKKNRMSRNLLRGYPEKCPPGGEDCVVMYTTTLRGIRKTFEECNAVRSAVESYNVRVMERDVSMDSGFKEELRKLMGTKEVRVPVVFVRGRLVGGAEEVVRLDEEGKLEGMFEGIAKGLVGCQGCGGIRFVMCVDCYGSCKVLDESRKSMVRCAQCNENGLIHCPICS